MILGFGRSIYAVVLAVETSAPGFGEDVWVGWLRMHRCCTLLVQLERVGRTELPVRDG